MMWHKTFEQRLASWQLLRSSSETLALPEALTAINDWWQKTPWSAFYLHWDDVERWPDPWQLLEDDVYCDLTRGLGILYTLSMMDRADIIDASLILTNDDYNVVTVNDSCYVLNYDSDTILNTRQLQIHRRLSSEQVKQKYA
jgi:hypothetical protein